LSVHRADDDLVVYVNLDAAPGGFELLSPGGTLRWGRCRFELNPPPDGRADFAVTLWNARPQDRVEVAPENTLFIAGEPREKKLYPKGFYRQFGHVVDSHSDSCHPHLHVSTLGLNWHVGLDRASNAYRFGYDHLAALARTEQANRIAVVCSNAARTAGQRARLDLLDALKQRLGDRLVHFGRGFTPIDDKLDAILPYRLHLVLENCIQPNYWTEKLADALLGWSYPVYLGCPNVGDYLPDAAFVSINGLDADTAAARITALLDAPLAAQQEAGLIEARRRVLDVYSPFAWMAQWVEWLHRPRLATHSVTILSHRAFRPFPRGQLYRLRRWLKSD
jgi:hypothetical protein